MAHYQGYTAEAAPSSLRYTAPEFHAQPPQPSPGTQIIYVPAAPTEPRKVAAAPRVPPEIPLLRGKPLSDKQNKAVVAQMFLRKYVDTPENRLRAWREIEASVIHEIEQREAEEEARRLQKAKNRADYEATLNSGPRKSRSRGGGNTNPGTRANSAQPTPTAQSSDWAEESEREESRPPPGSRYVGRNYDPNYRGGSRRIQRGYGNVGNRRGGQQSQGGQQHQQQQQSNNQPKKKRGKSLDREDDQGRTSDVSDAPKQTQQKKKPAGPNTNYVKVWPKADDLDPPYLHISRQEMLPEDIDSSKFTPEQLANHQGRLANNKKKAAAAFNIGKVYRPIRVMTVSDLLDTYKNTFPDSKTYGFKELYTGVGRQLVLDNPRYTITSAQAFPEINSGVLGTRVAVTANVFIEDIIPEVLYGHIYASMPDPFHYKGPVDRMIPLDKQKYYGSTILRAIGHKPGETYQLGSIQPLAEAIAEQDPDNIKSPPPKVKLTNAKVIKHDFDAGTFSGVESDVSESGLRGWELKLAARRAYDATPSVSHVVSRRNSRPASPDKDPLSLYGDKPQEQRPTSALTFVSEDGDPDSTLHDAAIMIMNHYAKVQSSPPPEELAQLYIRKLVALPAFKGIDKADVLAKLTQVLVDLYVKHTQPPAAAAAVTG